MVTRRLAGLLLRAAARRWPAELRAELVREWEAELHVLAGRGQRWRMLRFAASPAVSRAGAPVVDRGVLHRRLRRTARVLLLAPPACVAVVVLAAVVMNVAYTLLSANLAWATAVQLPLWSGLTAVAGALLALLVTRAARRTVRTGPLATALGVVLPIALTVTVVLVALAGRDDRGMPGTVPGLLLWLAALVPALWGAGILARRGRTRLAWVVGVLGALVAADAAVVLAVVSTIPAAPVAPVADGLPPDTVDRISAPLWLLTCWTDSSFGLPRPTAWERFLITDLVLIEPVFYLACTPYAVAYTLAAARPAPAAEPVPEPVPTPT
ncbi:hypothetical protein RMN56_19880 [Micromonospora halotolerans]|uniref:Uncharacterized protein n=1 Tax=Micromonospora halotolerans TaxID=709879 RepID=A0ABY9ZQD4_9ACTN|nr:hypothetical protein [Micromonospora halotolerans]WNM37424.1 hypothetical protein RMN56_19880 [Micromonospora halotolerans]